MATNGKIIKADADLGLVFGWAIICKEGGRDYYDTQDEHVPEKAMLKASATFMEKHRTLLEHHEGPNVGKVVFAWPMTDEICKAMGLECIRSGLMVAVKPHDPNTIAKIERGELVGFSIGGAHFEEDNA